MTQSEMGLKNFISLLTVYIIFQSSIYDNMVMLFIIAIKHAVSFFYFKG